MIVEENLVEVVDMFIGSMRSIEAKVMDENEGAKGKQPISQ